MRHRFLYCPTPKVACSSLPMTLRRIEAQDTHFLHDPWGTIPGARCNTASGLMAGQPPFTPPAVSPATISRCISSVSSSTGAVTSRAAAASGPQLTCSNVSTL